MRAMVASTNRKWFALALLSAVQFMVVLDIAIVNVARFIMDGHLLRHLRRMRELYPQRQVLMIEALSKASRGALKLPTSEQGMHLAFEAGSRRDDVAMSARAREAGVLLAPLSAYAIESSRRGWLFGRCCLSP